MHRHARAWPKASSIIITEALVAVAALSAMGAHAGPPAPIPLCPSPGADAVTTMCDTLAEQAAGQIPVHSPTLSDNDLLSSGVTLTIGPNDVPAVPYSTVMALTFGPYDDPVKSTTLGEEHTTWGTPTHGRLVWVLDDSPSPGRVEYMPTSFPPPSRITWSFVIVDAMTGRPLEGITAGSRPPYAGPPPPKLPQLPKQRSPMLPSAPSTLRRTPARHGWRTSRRHIPRPDADTLVRR